MLVRTAASLSRRRPLTYRNQRTRYNFNVKTMIPSSYDRSFSHRVEKDTFGDINVPADKYWGAQTQR